jgi:serine/threonine protein kinase
VSAEVAGYALGALVGRGGMAEVYRAVALRGPHAGRTVALKRLLPELARDPEHVALLADEAAVTQRLRHPAIVEVLETGVADGAPFLVMEYVDGRNLRDVLAQSWPARSRTRTRGSTRRGRRSGSCTATSPRRTCSCRASAR